MTKETEQQAVPWEGGSKLDWRKIAKAAGKHGVRYRTNTALEGFLSDIVPDATQTREAELVAEVERWRHKLWMVACHATGGGIPEIEGIDAGVNDICVQITQSRNMIYQAGKDAALSARGGA